MMIRKNLFLMIVLTLLVCASQVSAGSNANATLSLDLISNGGAGNQTDDGVTSGTISGQGTKIVIEANAISFNSVRPRLHLDTQIESPAQNNSVLIFTDKRPGDTLQIQLFVPSAAGTDIQAFTLELALQGKTFADFISSISGSDWTGGDLFPGTSASDNPTLSGLFLNAAPVPMTGYLGQIDLKVIGVLSDQDKLRVTSAFLAVGGGALQSVDVSNAELSFASICPGDFDDNGMVNMADFLLFGDVFGTRSSDARYNALMDMDSSGGIDVADFLLFVDVFDTTCEKLPPIDPDRDALVALYNATDGENWSFNANWLSNRPLGEWYGVTTDASGRVTHLELNQNGLSGVLPSELGDLTYLQELWLAENRLSSVLPPELGNLTNLRVLWLAANDLSDALPSELGDLTNLEVLGLCCNAFSDALPSELGDLTNLKELDLSANQFSGSLPLSLGNLTHLEELVLDNTQLCAPTDAAFQTWLQGIGTKSGVTNCEDGGGTPKIYWTDWNGGKIQRANLDGTGVEDLVSGLKGTSHIALDLGDGKMYWTATEAGKIQRANLDGTGVEDLVSGLRWPRGIALDLGNGKMYWTDAGRNKIQRANLDGTGVEDLVSEWIDPNDIALDLGAGKIYWTDPYGIQRANLDGTGVEDLVSGLDNPPGIVLDLGNGKMYWTDNQEKKIQRANLDGSGVEDLISGLDNPLGIALDLGNGKMYWTDGGTNKIQRSDLDGSNVEDLITGSVAPFDIALDTSGRISDGGGGGQTGISIPDANLRAVIVDSLGKASGAPITPSEMASLTRLEAPNSEISDLTGLEFATGLTRLDLGHEVVDNTIVNSNSISDISPLSNLTSLTWLNLNLSFNSISDVSALSNLTNLTVLSLYGNSISDISPLSSLTNLDWLELSGNGISDITPLSGLTGLTSLYLRFNSISDISPLSSLTNLRGLWLRQNNISDISSLSSLTNLRGLFLNSNSISDISSLSSLTNLDWLVLNSNSISDVSALSGLTNLRGLFLGGNQLTGSIPSWLGSFINLQRLVLSDNAGLSGPLPDSFTSLASLQYLYLAGTGLCAPTDEAFQTWLEGIENKSGVTNCD